jgi:hypothetical protein
LPVSLNVTDLGKLVKEWLGDDKKATKEWLNEVAKDADALAQVWAALYAKFVQSPDSKEFQIADNIPQQFRGYLYTSQTPTFWRLRAFYREASPFLLENTAIKTT